jgi:hypothetical protein
MPTSPAAETLGRKLPFKRLLLLLAVLSLMGAYGYGIFAQKEGTVARLEQLFPGKVAVLTHPAETMYALQDGVTGEQTSSVTLETVQGWGGPMTVGTQIDAKGAVIDVVVLFHTETPSFYQYVVQEGFFEQFPEKPLDSPFQLNEDVDAVTSATISSAAFTKAVRTGSHRVGRAVFGLEIEDPAQQLAAGQNELLLFALSVIVLACVWRKWSRARLYVLGASVYFLGVHTNGSLSISNFGALLRGFVPSPYEWLFWWLMVVGTLLITAVYGRNLYCWWLCPFGGMQEFVSKISGVNWKVSGRVARLLRVQAYLLLWLALMLTFLTNNPALAGFEPFATLFSLRGLGVQWYLVSVALASSLVIPRFWCRFLCPVGESLNLLAKTKRRLSRGSTKAAPQNQGAVTPAKKLPLTYADWTALGLSAVMTALILSYIYISLFPD